MLFGNLGFSGRSLTSRHQVASERNSLEMKSPLRILHLEDDPKDAELVQETLAIYGWNWPLISLR